MSSHRAEHMIRSSASSVIRKLSKASISGRFSNRSASVSSLTISNAESTCSVASNSKAESSLPKRPRLYETKSLDLLGNRNGAVAGPRHPKPPQRANSKLVSNRQRSKTVDVVRHETSAIPIIDGDLVSQTPAESPRPGGLLKAFSTDNIRGWFYTNGSPSTRA